jgi:SAM-dependent methyltransferase
MPQLTMDWAAHAGVAPQRYDEFLVPAMFGPFAEDLLDWVGLQPGTSVLDVACGTGALSRAAARRVGPTGRVVGLDISPAMLAVAAAQAPPPDSTPITYLEGDAGDLRLAGRRFDAVLCQQGLQFFADRHTALRRMSGAAAPGGRVALATWSGLEKAVAFAALVEALELYIGGDAAARMRQPFALADSSALAGLMEDAGLRQIEVSHVSQTGWPAGLAIH